MQLFQEKYEAVLAEFTRGKTMVLSTSVNNQVSSRMMSIVCINGSFYFQTDKTFRKYNQITLNPKVALCADNIQIEGICKEIGHPMDHAGFCKAYEARFGGSFRAYSYLKNERLFAVTPTYVERWIYQGSVPFLEIFHVNDQTYQLSKYEGT